MNCVVKAVSQLFPELDLSNFPARAVGYAMCDIQRMLPPELSVWIVYANRSKCINFDLIQSLPYCEEYYPLFLFSSIMSNRFKLHCELAYWDRDMIVIDGIEYDADEYFRRNKIIQVGALINYETHQFLVISK
jgi:hypothetical protein